MCLPLFAAGKAQGYPCGKAFDFDSETAGQSMRPGREVVNRTDASTHDSALLRRTNGPAA
jgi:hypothetical protein